ncbi:MFS domain-containing protein [Mycena chlorophos]|uniref:MFS domain-containing protein n=1 Tax=Mycena chlorophos TaxID=658473 RepID=A0A8H6W517_MYCCL|nr:MFS domain-containing protein [Mycena chlorophos]
MGVPSEESTSPTVLSTPAPPAKTPKTRAFYLSFAAISVTTFLAALDLAAVANVLPTISEALHDESGDYLWVGSAYSLSSTAVIPLTGNFANAFGRRPVMLSSIGLFAIGSALAGAAQNMSMLIAARTIQGVGGGGILTLSEILVADLVPLSERGIYAGLVALVWALASLVGPAIGGALASTGTKTWRWLFYLNLPICGLSALIVIFYLSVRTPEGTIRSKLAKIDWIGNAIIVSGATLAILGLTWGGSRYPWTSVKVLAPLVIGFVLVAAFFVFEATVPADPTIPRDVVSNRTSLVAILETAAHGVVTITFFQAVKGATPLRAAVDFLPASFLTTPSAFAGGIVITVTKKYRVVNWVGWIVIIVAFALLSTVTSAGVTQATLYGYQVLAAVGIGILFGGPMFPLLAPLPPNRAAAALSLFTFTRSFSNTWGIAIGGTILQNELTKRLPAEFLAMFPAGSDIAYSSIPTIRTLPEPLRGQVQDAFAASLAIIWRVMAGICGAGLIVSLFMKELPLATAVDESYALQEKEEKEKPASAADTNTAV